MTTVAEQCAEAIQAIIRNLGMEGIEADEVKIRSIPSQEILPRGISIVAREELEGGGTNAKDDYGYPFMIVMSRGNGRPWSEDAATLANWRNSIRKAFNNKRLREVDKVHICGVQNGDYLQTKQWQENKTASILTITCWAREART
jgi:hypothetical protein